MGLKLDSPDYLKEDSSDLLDIFKSNSYSLISYSSFWLLMV